MPFDNDITVIEESGIEKGLADFMMEFLYPSLMLETQSL